MKIKGVRKINNLTQPDEYKPILDNAMITRSDSYEERSAVYQNRQERCPKQPKIRAIAQSLKQWDGLAIHLDKTKFQK